MGPIAVIGPVLMMLPRSRNKITGTPYKKGYWLFNRGAIVIEVENVARLAGRCVLLDEVPLRWLEDNQVPRRLGVPAQEPLREMYSNPFLVLLTAR